MLFTSAPAYGAVFPVPAVEAAASSGKPGDDIDGDTRPSGFGYNTGSDAYVSPDTVYVPDDYSTIQAALDAVVAGGTIVLRDGIYTGDGNKWLKFNGKAATVRSENGPANCVIDSEGSYPAFLFRGGDGRDSVVDGITIRNGHYTEGGGIQCWGASPTIRNCIIENCTSLATGGGIYCYSSSPLITNCVIVNNTAEENGGGGISCRDSSPIISNCTISGNRVLHFLSHDGYGGGIRAFSGASATVTNCILWDNSAVDGGPEIALRWGASLTLSYCDVEGGAGAAYVEADCSLTSGPGNIDSDPFFLNPGGGDYHLQACSPGIDAGDPASDYSIEPEPNGGRINMDAYGNTLEAATSVQTTDDDGDTYSECDGDCHDNNPNNYPGAIETCDDGADNDCDGLIDAEDSDCGPHTIYVDCGNTCPGSGTPGDPYCEIQTALDTAAGGDTIIVSDGVCAGANNRNLDFKQKMLTLRSENGRENCIIDCGDSGRGFYFHSGEGPGSVVDGFTITNGSVPGNGGGIYCGDASPTIMNCVISNNSADAGGGILTENASPTISNCLIAGNSSTYGGGIYSSGVPSPNIRNCAISGNSAYAGGGVLAYAGSPGITNCIVSGNSATYGAGLYYSCTPPSVLTNCAIIENSASAGGGISAYYSTLEVKNCILWKNSASWGSDYGPSLTIGAAENCPSVSISYSNVEGGISSVRVEPGCTLDWDNISNITADPLFVQPRYRDGVEYIGDYHLSCASPCIDAGNNSGAPADDADGDARPQGAGCDIGADEYIEGLQQLSLRLVPDSDEASQGGTAGYTVTVNNCDGSPITFDYWTNVTRPDGITYPPSGALFGPYSVTLGGSSSRSAHLTHPIPAIAPLGMYTYNAFIGDHPTLMNEYHFNFDVD